MPKIRYVDRTFSAMIDRTDRTSERAAALAALASRGGNPALFTAYCRRLDPARRARFAAAYYARMPAPGQEVAPGNVDIGPDAQATLGAAMKGGGKL